MKHLVAVAAFSLALGVAAGAQATEFVVNGDFTQLSNGPGQMDAKTVATGWSANGGYNFVFNQADVGVPSIYGDLSLWDAANGGSNSWDGLAAGAGNFLAMDGDFTTAAVTQVISGLTVGQTYHFSFNYAFGQQTGFSGETIQHLSVSLGNDSATSMDFNVADHGFTGWQSAGGDVVATATSETLSFLAYGNLPVPPFALVSNVSLTGAPEPATWGLMLLGFGGMGALARTRRRAAAA